MLAIHASHVIHVAHGPLPQIRSTIQTNRHHNPTQIAATARPATLTNITSMFQLTKKAPGPIPSDTGYRISLTIPNRLYTPLTAPVQTINRACAQNC